MNNPQILKTFYCKAFQLINYEISSFSWPHFLKANSDENKIYKEIRLDAVVYWFVFKRGQNYEK